MSDEDENEDLAEEGACPFCASTGGCEHLLLLVDQTFGTCDGGALFEAFGDRWRTISDREGDDFDDSASFNELLDEVEPLADASFEFVIEGGPGMTSKYGIYFCSSDARVTDAVRKFEAASAAYADAEGDHCPFCKSLNAPAAGETCAHHVGWKWDGTFELDADLEALQRGWQEAGDYFRTLSGLPDFEGSTAVLVGGVAHSQRLIDLAAEDAKFSDLLEAVGVNIGGGWQTQGMLGGSGFNLYSDDLKPVNEATALYGQVCQVAEQLEDAAPTELVAAPVVQNPSGQKRAVLIVVTQWPGGTMAIKFGYAMRDALQVSPEDMKLVQMEPERIFRAATYVSEEQFRSAMKESGLSCPSRVIFIEM